MRVLILTDASFATREREMLLRLQVGLADEGVRIIHAVPRSAAPEEGQPPAGQVFVEQVVYEDRGPGFLGRLRDRRFAEQIDRLHDPADERPVDVVHVFGEPGSGSGGGAWATGAELAARFQAALGIEVWSAECVERAARLHPASGVDRPPTVFFAPDRPTEGRLREEVERPGIGAVRYTPWGVHTPASAHDLLAEGRSPSVMIAGSGRDSGSYAAALAGLAAPGPQSRLMIFADAEAMGRARAWPVVNRLGLIDRFTLAPDIEGRRDLTLKCDLLLIAEALGEHRTLVLDAMAVGALVVAAPDPMVGWLIDGRTARLVDRAQPDSWAALLASLLSDEPGARVLAASARKHVRQQQRASAHVASVVDAYEWLTAGDALPFGGATA